MHRFVGVAAINIVGQFDNDCLGHRAILTERVLPDQWVNRAAKALRLPGLAAVPGPFVIRSSLS
jgi:hypothetical protein